MTGSLDDRLDPLVRLLYPADHAAVRARLLSLAVPSLALLPLALLAVLRLLTLLPLTLLALALPSLTLLALLVLLALPPGPALQAAAGQAILKPRRPRFGGPALVA